MNILSQKYDEKEQTFTSYLLKHFNVLKKMSSLKIYMNKDISHKDEFWIKKINEIIYGQDALNWDVLYDVMNKLHNDFFIRLKELYPQLKEIEYRILCLTYSGFSTVEISIVLNLSVNTINMKRSAIRKSLDIVAFTNLRDFLNEKLN
ncbi:helix-turn-helix transcriptional regulator [Parabacteroides leei]|uniref:helix-turn-helix transcriptional regulator n=1 Tax=Parabacteroides leei TaxID=2939491 RepID=UPI0032426F1A